MPKEKMERLFIAEKPALAKVIADALGNARRHEGYFECGSDVVTYCVGHLLELSPPEVHNPAYAKWRKADLPLKLRPAKYQPIERTVAQFKVVKGLLEKATSVVHAGDPDDEGQLLIDEVLTFCQYRGPVKRVLINDLNTQAAKKALQNLRDNTDFIGLSQKALARSIGDQLYGFNLTRAYTLAAQEKGIEGVLSVGRVQTPILGLIVNRFLANKNHAATFFYALTADIEVQSHKLTPRFVVPENAPVDDKGRLINEVYANAVKTACKGKPARVTACDAQEKQTSAPLPFSLLDLQAAMSKRHGLSAQETLEITQSLREKHKAITYNRSDCNYLTDEQYLEAPITLDAIAKALPELAGHFAQTDRTRKSRAFDQSKVSAHTAIIPSTTTPVMGEMSAKERLVYQAIAEQYLAQFLPEKKYLAAKAEFTVSSFIFAISATQVTEPGWSALLSSSDEKEDSEQEIDESTNNKTFAALSALKVEDTGTCHEVKVTKEKTKPLPLYTEATLLKDLQRVAKYVKDPRIRQLLKDRDAGKAGEHGGIGTPATRAAMLETLQKRGFYTVEKKKLIPTQRGLDFIASLPEIATASDMTALWHEQQQQIEQGMLTVDQFLDTLDAFIEQQVGNVQLSAMGGMAKQVTFTRQNARLTAKCPKCRSEIAITPKVFACTGCEIKVWATIAGKTLTEAQAEALFEHGKTPLLKGFKSKAGKPFDAMLALNIKLNKVEFAFQQK